MEFNVDSKIAKFYRWYYESEEDWFFEMPKDTCTYYKNLIKAFLLILPITLFSFPTLIYYYVKKEKASVKEKLNKAGFVYFLVLVITWFILMLLSPFLVYFGEYGEKTLPYQIFPVGLFMWILFIFYGIYHGIMWVISLIKKKERKTILGSYIKSVKEKYCEQITWIE